MNRAAPDSTDRRSRPPLAGPLGRALEPLYALGVARRNRRFDARKGVIEFDRPVLSVGNLSVGGTGKTPMVHWLLERLIRAGRHPCIAMRGYRGGQNSDEVLAHRARFPNVPIVAQAERVDGLIDLFATEEGARVDCVVLDDGFQHRFIARQADIVLVDALRDPFRDRLLPAGWLREPAASLSRADGVVVTHADEATEVELRELFRRLAGVLRPGAPIAAARHAWAGVEVHSAGGSKLEPTEYLRGRSVVGACAIGNPGAFLAQVERAAGRPCAARVVLADHDSYQAPTVARLFDAARQHGAAAIVTTEKDWVKLGKRSVAWPCEIVVPRLELELVSGEKELWSVVERALRSPLQ